ncbi:hypothetical protein LAN29_25625, partial [Mycobacterium tuberculosis]|nr:hypothetical protein [Mycobacterium tuberculosis]
MSGLYISSIPNKNTVDFYLAQGCRLADKPDPALFALEPEDIHLVCDRLYLRGPKGDGKREHYPPN